MRLPSEPLIFVLLLLASCRIEKDYQGTAYACPEGRCPPGFECVNGRCVEPGTVDAAADPDAPPTGPDASCACEPGSYADSCQGGSLVDLDGARSPAGQTVCASTQMNTNLFYGCTGAPMPSSDAVFRIPLEGGEALTAELRPEGFDGALYLVTDCSTTVCEAIADEAGVGGTETLRVTADQTADHYLVVDSDSWVGCYRLHVKVE